MSFLLPNLLHFARLLRALGLDVQAGRMLDEGVAIDAIDRALLDFGFPVGPITLLDEVGLDIAAKSGAIMANAFGDRLQRSPRGTRLCRKKAVR